MTAARLFLFFITCLFASSTAHAVGPYFEGGTSYGKSNTYGSGFIGSFSFYLPVTSELNFIHADLGLQNRFSTFSGAANQSFAAFSPNLSARIEFWRLYAGAGYAPLVFQGEGLTGLKSASGASAYFVEGGMMWRVIPELQIAATAAIEFMKPSGGGSSSNATEIGLRFRFPINPKERSKRGGAVDFDGFRYPFGFMRD